MLGGLVGCQLHILFRWMSGIHPLWTFRLSHHPAPTWTEPRSPPGTLSDMNALQVKRRRAVYARVFTAANMFVWPDPYGRHVRAPS
ncbi:MAG: hypothetical protein QOG25_782 [Acetobacteraceae bacterium]|jgi:hypothetical protein|nr:hypothetical protein [Acetobacteraceae bacterium]